MDVLNESTTWIHKKLTCMHEKGNHFSSHHSFSLRTCSSSLGVKSFLILNVFLISSGVLPLIILATVLHVTSNNPWNETYYTFQTYLSIFVANISLTLSMKRLPLYLNNLLPKLVQTMFLDLLWGNLSPKRKCRLFVSPCSHHPLVVVDHPCDKLPIAVPAKIIIMSKSKSNPQEYILIYKD